MPRIGAHVSVNGGLYTGIENAKAIGAETIQIFGSSPRQWFTRTPLEPEIEKYQAYLEDSDIDPVFLHAAYLVNLASPDDVIRLKSIKSLADHLNIVQLIGAAGLIFHIGSGKEMPAEEAEIEVVKGVKEVLRRVPGDARLVMENSSGGGQKLGGSADGIGRLLQKIDSPRVKVCFDTAHAFEAGIIEDYSSSGVRKLFDDWDKKVGLPNIVAIHANDSKTPFNSHHDRHENIGQGYIGFSGFKSLAREKRLWDKPWILEVPGYENQGPDKENVKALKSIFA